MADILQINGIRKSFGTKEVLKGVSLRVPEHTVFGFVGQNGAGKTTTMKAILGLLTLDAGEIYVDGQKVGFGNTQTNKVIGYLPDVPDFYSYMMPMEYLCFCGELSGIEKKELRGRSEEMLRKVGLAGEKHRIKGFSRGMKQRLGVAQALLHRPKLLICDEPTSALDPIGRKDLLDILTGVKGETTVFFSTHILSDVERISDEVAFLHGGQIVLAGRMSDVRKMHRSNDTEVVFGSSRAAQTFAEQFENAMLLPGYRVCLKNLKEEERFRALEVISEFQLDFESITKSEWDLERLFLEVAGK